MKGRTIREFTYNDEIWPLLDRWAAGNGFVLLEQQASTRVYRKGNRLVAAPAFLQVSQQGAKINVQAWVKADMYLIMSVLTGKPAEAGIDSGGLTAWIPRMRARNAVNTLLQELGQPPVV